MAYASPVSRSELVQEDQSELLQVVRVIEKYHDLWNSDASAACPANTTGADENDLFFLEQAKRFNAGLPSFLEEDEITAPIVLRWRAMWLLHVRSYLANSLGDAAEDVGPLRIFFWAGVHEDCNEHPTHVHPEAV